MSKSGQTGFRKTREGPDKTHHDHLPKTKIAYRRFAAFARDTVKTVEEKRKSEGILEMRGG